jgi:hypothetical protein
VLCVKQISEHSTCRDIRKREARIRWAGSHNDQTAWRLEPRVQLLFKYKAHDIDVRIPGAIEKSALISILPL